MVPIKAAGKASVPLPAMGNPGKEKAFEAVPDGQGERTRKANRASCTAEEPDASPLTGSRPRRRIRP
ncbi:MAG: hypothetical protein CW342_12330 [Thermoactinomycetaceae bacterium]|nr:hypothetical protein [Thermoactinomycetaceae bacterium]